MIIIEINIKIVYKHPPMNLPKIQTLLLLVLISITFIPYVATFMRLGGSLLFNIEIVALVCWYITSLAIPLVIKEVDSTLVLWCFTFVLVGIVIGSDMVYRMTGIDPAEWYDYFGRINPNMYYSFMYNWFFLITPGCVLFIGILLFQIFSGKLKEKS